VQLLEHVQIQNWFDEAKHNLVPFPEGVPVHLDGVRRYANK
jgi:hypothetical protein